MAASSRYGSIVLSRIAAPSTRLSTTQARAFSTSFAVRFNASRANQNDQGNFPPRLNPLVGNHVLQSAPQPAPQPAAVAESPAPSAPKSSSSFKADFIPPPPPPPPPPPAASAESPFQALFPESPKSADHPYSAAESSTPRNIDIADIISNRAASFGQSLGICDPLERPKIRAKAVAGRTVFIKDRLTPSSAPTPAVAIRVLEKMCRDQKVRNKYHSQKFHERKGLKKKRLRSQRWRARFKTGFKAAVSKVMELKKQGW